MNLRRMVLVWGLMLGILMVIKLMPTDRVGPVQVGVDAVTAASRSAARSGGGSASKGSTRKSGTPAAKEEGTGEGQAQFVTWQKGTDRGKPALYLDVVPRVGLGYASLVVPNKNAADEMINPPAEVAALAPRLRIGDVVRVSFSRPRGKLVVNALDIVKASDQDANSKLFTYGGVRTSKVDGQDRAAVSLRRKNLSWLFMVPASGGATIVPVASTTGPKPPPLSQEWAESLSRFRSGDQVFVEYETADYQFVLKDISACQMAIHGVFLRTGKDTQTVKGSPTVVIQVGDGELSLLLPEQGTALNGAPAGDASTYPSLKGVRPGQEVDVKYHKESGALWLDEISAAAKR